MTTIKGFEPWWKTPKFIVPVLVVAIVAGVLLIRSRNQPSSQDEALRVATYCQSATQLDELASTTGVSSTSGTFDGPPEALTSFAQQARPVLAEMKLNAPSEVRSEVEVLSSAVEDASGGDVAALTSPSLGTARARLTTYQSSSCLVGSSSGDG